MAKIKLFDPYTDKSEKVAVKRVLDSHFWASGAGTGEVQKFEKEFSKYTDSKCCVALNRPKDLVETLFAVCHFVSS